MNNRMRLSFLLIAFLISFISLCTCDNKNRKEEILKTELLLDSINSKIADRRFPFKKMLITYADSILIQRFYSADYTFESVFYKKDKGVFEFRKRGFKADIDMGIDTLLTFYTLEDTTIIYDPKIESVPSIFEYTLVGAKYEIKKNRNEYITTKQSLLDTTYKEIFFYDKDYHIYKFINTWKGNICVYVEKKW